MDYFSVPNLERYQHYRDRSPKWIKLHQTLTEDYEFARLPDDAKFHLIGIWLLASRLCNKIPLDQEWVKSRIGAATPVRLDLLLEAGFIKKVRNSAPVQNCTDLYQNAPKVSTYLEHSDTDPEQNRINPYQNASLEREESRERVERESESSRARARDAPEPSFDDCPDTPHTNTPTPDLIEQARALRELLRETASDARRHTAATNLRHISEELDRRGVGRPRPT